MNTGRLRGMRRGIAREMGVSMMVRMLSWDKGERIDVRMRGGGRVRKGEKGATEEGGEGREQIERGVRKRENV